MTIKLTKPQAKHFNEIHKRGTITEEDRKIFPGIHFCQDWDFLLIWDGLPDEMMRCVCKRWENIPKPEELAEYWLSDFDLYKSCEKWLEDRSIIR